MRPHITNGAGALVPDLAARLYVKRDTMCPRAWRLAWMVPGSGSYCMAEGECSARYFRTRASARAYGQCAYGEQAAAWPRRGA